MLFKDPLHEETSSSFIVEIDARIHSGLHLAVIDHKRDMLRADGGKACAVGAFIVLAEEYHAVDSALHVGTDVVGRAICLPACRAEQKRVAGCIESLLYALERLGEAGNRKVLVDHDTGTEGLAAPHSTGIGVGDIAQICYCLHHALAGLGPKLLSGRVIDHIGDGGRSDACSFGYIA